jgi:hypothetical protein
MSEGMSVFFNLLLFVGVFYLILRAPEPGDWSANRAYRDPEDVEPARKIA